MSDVISRQAAIEALTKDKKALEHIINEMSGHEKEFDRLVGQRNQVEYDIYAIEQLPPAQPEIIDGRLFVTVDDIKKVGCVLVDEHKSNFCRQFWMDGDGHASCEDAVSRKAVQCLLAYFVDEDKYVDACDGLKHLPPVTPKQRTGYWIDDGSELGCQCSECGKSLDEYIHATECMTLIEIPKLCPNCGAKMEGDAE